MNMERAMMAKKMIPSSIFFVRLEEDGFGNSFDAAYDYTAAPTVTPTVLWTMDGNTSQTPTPNSYNNSHTYNYTFVAGNAGSVPGMGIHTWAVPSSLYNGNLNFSLYQIDTSINIYNYVNKFNITKIHLKALCFHSKSGIHNHQHFYESIR